MTTAEGRGTRPVAKIAADELADVTLTVNGTEATVSVPPRMHLADVLRERLGLTGTHLGCEHGVCGMCTVLVDGEAARACLLFAVQCDGADVVTVEGLGLPDDQHPLQQAFSHHHGLQCGFCTPGMLMSGYDLLAHEPEVDAAELPERMSGVLCRCTGYRGILAAVADVAEEYPEGVPAPRGCGPRTLVGRTGSARAGAALAGAAASGPPVPDEVRMPTGEPSARVAVRSDLAAGVVDVWGVLDDIGLLVGCLPGAELVASLDEWRHRGRATVALGPVTLRFDGLAQIVERDPDGHRLRVLAQGADVAGSATRAVIALRVEAGDDGGSTLVADADLYLSGRIAQFGRALAGDVSRRLFETFGRSVDEAARTGTAPAVTASTPLQMAATGVLEALRASAARLRDRLRTLRRRP